MGLFGQIGYSLGDQRLGVCSLQGKDTFYFLYKLQIPSRATVPFMGDKAATA
jgi:hypothetical protein